MSFNAVYFWLPWRVDRGQHNDNNNNNSNNKHGDYQHVDYNNNLGLVLDISFFLFDALFLCFCWINVTFFIVYQLEQKPQTQR